MIHEELEFAMIVVVEVEVEEVKQNDGADCIKLKSYNQPGPTAAPGDNTVCNPLFHNEGSEDDL